MPMHSKFQPKEPLVPERFREARLSRGMTAQDLADKIGVSRQSISKYELGISEPAQSIISALAKELNFPLSFFYAEPTAAPNRGTTFYRSLKTNAARAKEVLSVKSNWAVQISNLIQEKILFPEVDVPQLPSEYEQQASFSYDDIENISQHVRSSWELGDAPVSNLSHTLESHGIVIVTIKTGFNETDACSSIIDKRPYIFLDIEKECAVRTRFNLAHELGHLILHKNVQQADIEDKKTLDRIEQEANQFASCLLLPKDAFLRDIHSSSLQSFLPLKQKWKVSIQAMIYRCKELEIFSDSQMIYLQKQISAKRWRKNEPYDDLWPCEEPVILSKAVNMILSRDVYSKDAFLEKLKLPPADIEVICFLPASFLSPVDTSDSVIINFADIKPHN